jgi:hypothetical protein
MSDIIRMVVVRMERNLGHGSSGRKLAQQSKNMSLIPSTAKRRKTGQCVFASGVAQVVKVPT